MIQSSKEMFLQQLISFGSDVLGKVRFQSLALRNKLDRDRDLPIDGPPDKEAKTLAVCDSRNSIREAEDISAADGPSVSTSHTPEKLPIRVNFQGPPEVDISRAQQQKHVEWLREEEAIGDYSHSGLTHTT
jgi:hypothetical protein